MHLHKLKKHVPTVVLFADFRLMEILYVQPLLNFPVHQHYLLHSAF